MRQSRRRRARLGAGLAAAAAALAVAPSALGVSFPTQVPTTGAGWASAGPQALAVDPAGSVWFVERGATGPGEPQPFPNGVAALGRYTPGAGIVYEVTAPNVSAIAAAAGPDARAESVAVSPSGRFVYVLLTDPDAQPGSTTSIVRVDTAVGSPADADADSRRVIRCPTPGGFGGPVEIVVLPDGQVAFTASTGGAVGVWRRAGEVSAGSPSAICSPGVTGTTLSDTWRSYDVDVVAPGRQPAGLDINPATGLLYATLRANNPLDAPAGFPRIGVMVVNPALAPSDPASDRYIALTKPPDAAQSPSPGDVDVDAARSTLWFVNEDPTGAGAAYKVVSVPLAANGLEGGPPTFHSVGSQQSSQPRGVEVDPTGAVWFTDQDVAQTADILGRKLPTEPTFSQFRGLPPGYIGTQDIVFAGNRGFVAAKFAPGTGGDRGAIGEVLLDGAGAAGPGSRLEVRPSGAICLRTAAPRRSSRSKGRVTLTVRQLAINQRIYAAAVRRANAVEGWLSAGLQNADLCGAGLGAAEFGPGVTTGPAGGTLVVSAPEPRPITPAEAKKKRGVRFRLNVRQLQINQRIAAAGVRRANALGARLSGGLTGGDVQDGAVTLGKLAAGLGIVTAGPAGAPVKASVTRVAKAKRKAGVRFELSAGQLLINQRVGQAAIRRLNGTIALLEAGLEGKDIRDRTLGAADLDPALR